LIKFFSHSLANAKDIIFHSVDETAHEISTFNPPTRS